MLEKERQKKKRKRKEKLINSYKCQLPCMLACLVVRVSIFIKYNLNKWRKGSTLNRISCTCYVMGSLLTRKRKFVKVVAKCGLK
jgi:hypothetical protein